MNTGPPPVTMLATLLVALLLCTQSSCGVRIYAEKRLLPFINRMYLHCADNNQVDLSGPVSFYRSTINGEGQLETELFANEVTAITAFNITPHNEGVFTCAENMVFSNNNITLVAFPYINSSFTLPQEKAVSVGHTSPALYCGFTLGALPQFYEVEWWRGTSRLDTTNDSSRYRILDNLTLLIQDTQINDASGGYYCLLRVVNPTEGVVYNNTSPDISLQVYNPLTLTSTLTDTAITIGQSASFTCTAQGVPQPNIRWKVNKNSLNNPRYTIQEQVSSTSLIYTATSTLTLTDTTLTDSGQVECITYNSNKEGIVIDTNTATLVVIGVPSVPVLVATQDGGLFLTVNLPSVLPVFFLVHIRYVSTADANSNYETVLASPSFTNTSTIANYKIPAHNLPAFSSFRAQVALQVYGVRGQYSTMSSITVLLEPLTTPSATPMITASTGRTCTNACTDNVSLYIIIGLLTTALIVVLLFLACVAVYFCCYKNKFKDQLQSTLPVAFRSNGEDIKLPPPGTGHDYVIRDKEIVNSAYSTSGVTCTSCTSDDHTCCSHTCTSPPTSSVVDERKSESGSPPVIYVNEIKNSGSPARRSNHYTMDPAIESLTSEPQVIKAAVLMEEIPIETREEEQDEEEEKTAEYLSQPKSLYNDSLSSSQGNIAGLFADMDTIVPPTSLDQSSHSTSVQTSVEVPSFSQITNHPSSSSSSTKPEEKTKEGNDVDVTKSMKKLLRGYEIV